MSENYIKCSGCGEIVTIPAELYPDPIGGEIPLSEPYYCDSCEEEEEVEAMEAFEISEEDEEPS